MEHGFMLATGRGLMAATNLAVHMGLSRLSYCARYLGRRRCIVDRQAPLWSKTLSISNAYSQFRRWHVACDAEPAQTPAGAQARASNERDIAMIHSTRTVAERPIARRWLLATGLTLGLLAAMPSAKAQDTIKVGILHSLSGTMAISETTLKDVMLMLIDEQNKKGGLLGKKLEAVVVDPASNWPLFAEKARELISKEKVAAVFGCWTSVSRKSVLPVFKELNNILFYPVQYEGEESERNVFYTGAAPNQQAIPAVDYLEKEEKVQRWVLAGTDYVYPRTTNKILEAYLKSKGVKQEDIMINYTPFGHSDWQTIVADIKKFGSAGKKTAIVSTINGDANVPFYKELGNQGIKATDIPSVAFSVGEEELAGIDTKPVFGGEIKANGQFDVVWKTPGLVAGDAWSKELEGSKDLIGDWVGKKCGNYNVKTNKCGGQGS